MPIDTHGLAIKKVMAVNANVAMEFCTELY